VNVNLHELLIILMLDFKSAINVALAFCMGNNIENILSNPIGQPMATVRDLRSPGANLFNPKGPRK
jgi:hypothetical protein